MPESQIVETLIEEAMRIAEGMEAVDGAAASVDRLLTPSRRRRRRRLRPVLTTRHGVRPLGAADLDAFLELARRDPVVNVFADYRASTTNLEPRWLGGEMWGRFEGGELAAACHVGANLVPVQATAEDAAAFAERALARGRTVSTIVGPQEAVRVFWNGVAGSWGRPREARWEQPHLEIAEPPLVAPDPLRAADDARATWTSSTRRAWRCTPRRSGSRRSTAGERTSTAPGSPS